MKFETREERERRFRHRSAALVVLPPVAREHRDRRPHAVRKATIAMNRYPKRALDWERRLLELFPLEEDSERPKTRADCAKLPRPCPYVSCRWHLYLDVTDRGNLTLNFPDLEPDELPISCALDVADQGPHRLEEVGLLMNLVRERVRQIEVDAKRKLRRLPVIREVGREC